MLLKIILGNINTCFFHLSHFGLGFCFILKECKGGDCQQYFNSENNSFFLPEDSICQIQSNDSFMNEELKLLKIEGILRIEDEFSFSIFFEELEIGPKGILSIGLNKQIQDNFILLHHYKKNCSINDSTPSGQIFINSFQFKAYKVQTSIYSTNQQVYFENIPINIIPKETIALVASINKYSRSIMTSKEIKNKELIMENQFTIEHQLYEYSPWLKIIAFNHERQYSGVILENFCAHIKIQEISGALFKNTRTLIFDGRGKIKDSMFYSESHFTKKTHLIFNSDIQSNIFYQMSLVDLQQPVEFKFVQNVLVEVNNSKFQVNNILSHTELYNCKNITFLMSNGTSTFQIYKNYFAFSLLQLKFLEGKDNQFNLVFGSNIIYKSSIINTDGINNLKIVNSTIIESVPFTTESTSKLQNLTILSSDIRGNEILSYFIDFHPNLLIVQKNPINIVIRANVFTGFHRSVFTIGHENSQNQYQNCSQTVSRTKNMKFNITFEQNQFQTYSHKLINQQFFDLCDVWIRYSAPEISQDNQNNISIIQLDKERHFYHNLEQFHIPLFKDHLSYFFYVVNKKLSFYTLNIPLSDEQSLHQYGISLMSNELKKIYHIQQEMLILPDEEHILLLLAYSLDGEEKSKEPLQITELEVKLEQDQGFEKDNKQKSMVFISEQAAIYEIFATFISKNEQTFQLKDCSSQSTNFLIIHHCIQNNIFFSLDQRNNGFRIFWNNLEEESLIFKVQINYCHEKQVLNITESKHSICLNECPENKIPCSFICLNSLDSCPKCSIGCQECKIENIFCSSCLDGYYKQGAYCFRNCPRGTFLNENTCEDCNTDCSMYTNDSECLQCKQQKLKEQNFEGCSFELPCTNCVQEGCQKCFGKNWFECSKCLSNYKLVYGQCQKLQSKRKRIQKCYKEQNQISFSVCQQCPTGCKSCLSLENLLYCYECPPSNDNIEISIGNQVDCIQCPINNYYDKNSCERCNHSCSQEGCSGPSNSHCKSCKEGFERNQLTNKCLQIVES